MTDRSVTLTGTTFAGNKVRIKFESTPGAIEPQIRITTPDGPIYVAERDFAEMVVYIFAGSTEGKHFKK